MPNLYPKITITALVLCTALCLCAAVCCNRQNDAAADAPPPAVDTSRFTDDRDGREYRAVKIGEQTWMAENLRFEADSSSCYGGDESNCEKYGRLYAWAAAVDACPAGWHLPNNAEWDSLIFAAGKRVAGKRLKSKTGWAGNGGKSGNGTDELGFSALPGGRISDYSDPNASRTTLPEWYGWWWSADEDVKYRAAAYCRGIINVSYNDSVNLDLDSKESRLSVRCVLGEGPPRPSRMVEGL